MSDVEDYLRDSLRLDDMLVHAAAENDRLVGALESAGLEIEQLRTALVNRLLIGQAQGILMERLRIDAPQAFAYLRRASMQLNRKVVEVAAEIATTRTLPTLH